MHPTPHTTPVLDRLLGWIAPTPCRACGLGVHPLCEACRAELEDLRGTTRSVGGLPVRCLGAYDGTLRQLVMAAKSEVLPWLTGQLGERLVDIFSREAATECIEPNRTIKPSYLSYIIERVNAKISP